MQYDPIFYFNEKHDVVHYTSKVQAICDINRIINGQPAWKDSNFTNIPKPKALIIADWTAWSWSQDKIQQITAKLKQLMLDGFPIYLWQRKNKKNYKISLLTQDSLSCLDKPEIRDTITPSEHEKIIKQAISQQQLTENRIHILTDYWLEYLLIGNKLPLTQHKLYLSTLNESYDALEIIRYATPKIVEIVHDEFSQKANEILIKIQKNFPNIQITQRYQSLILNDNESINNLHQNQQHIIENAIFKWTELTALKNFYFTSNDNFNINTLYKILNATPKLKNLNVQIQDQLEQLNVDTQINLEFKELEFLNLSKSSITAMNLLKLLAHTIKLKILDLSSCLKLDDDFDGELKLTLLESLNLNQSFITISNLQKLLLAAPNLTTLSLNFCKQLTVDFDAEIKLRSLKSLNLNASSITVSNLQKLLLAAPNLTTLNLSYCKQLNIDFDVEFKLASLESLDLNNSPITVNNLQKLLLAAPNLTTLKLFDYTQFDAELKLASLESLALHASPITISNLQKLLLTTPNLTTFNLSYYKQLNIDFDVEFKLASLKSLNLNDSPITVNNLQKLLLAAPNLTKLNLSGCYETLSVDFNTKLQLRSLKSLDLNYSVIKVSNLQKLLLAAPNLKTLNLSSCKQLNVDFDAELQLRSLKSLDLNGSAITVSNLQKLLLAAPNLTKLNLSGCKKLNIDFDAKLKLESLESLILINSSITASNLKKLLLAAPNLTMANLVHCHLIKIDLNLQEQLNQLLKHIKKVFISSNNKAFSSNTELTINTRQQQHIPTNPQHDPTKHLNYKPTAADAEFTFRGINKTKNQRMIIEKLSQYFTLTKQHQAIIPKLQDGICNALSHYCLTKKDAEWQVAINLIANWDGRLENLNQQLKATFKELFQYIQDYQLKNNYTNTNQIYLGDRIQQFLQQNILCSYIINNPWHAVAIKHELDEKNKNIKFFYDANHIDGGRKVINAELLDAIKNSLGNLVSVNKYFINSILSGKMINSAEEFIATGGLLSLCECSNVEEMLKELREQGPISLKGLLDGLFLRDSYGVPAWAKGITNSNTKICQYTLSLLENFMQTSHNPNVHFQNSLEAVSAKERNEYIQHMLDTQNLLGIPTDYSIIPALCDAICKAPVSTELYEQALKTWLKDNPPITNTLQYCQQLCQIDNTQKYLIELDSSLTVQALLFNLEKHCRSIQRPYFIINSPEDLICSAPYIHRNQNRGILVQGPGGPLHAFLQTKYDPNNPPTLIVNYDHFDPDDIVRFNSLLDDNASADGTILPTSTKILGLINITKPDCYQGADFYSRFNNVETCPLSTDNLLKSITPLPILSAKNNSEDIDNSNAIVINLYNGTDWQERLLGSWLVDTQGLSFQEGLLLPALKKAQQNNQSIIIENGLWDNEKFQHFWQQAFLRGAIEQNGLKIELPHNVKFLRKEGYAWADLTKDLQWEYELKLDSQTQYPTLNPNQLNEFFIRFQCDNQHKTLIYSPGYIESHAKNNPNEKLSINITRNLDDNNWARLLHTCQEHSVHLKIHAAPSVVLPEWWPQQPFNKFQETNILPSWEKKITATTSVIFSTDLDSTIDIISAKTEDQAEKWQIIDVSECDQTDLLIHTDSKLNSEKLSLEFTQTKRILLTALDEDKNVLLKGHFSSELADALAPLLLERHSNKETLGKLVLLTDAKETFAYFPIQSLHEVSLAEKKALLMTKFSVTDIEKLDDLSITKEPLSQLQARLSYLKQHPNESSENAWSGMRHLPGIQLAKFNAEKSAEIAESFNTERLKLVNAVLANNPYVFLTGLTAVGKSTFVTNYLSSTNSSLYHGETAMQAWAQDTSKHHKILFIDEANLSAREWSEFEGLFNEPPSILIAGEYYQLTAKHKVIFAGNPVNYGDERKLADFFARHGNAVVFNPMPQEFIYENMLKPIFAGTVLEDKTLTISEPLLKIYIILCNYSKDEILISPRELQMIALLVLTYHKNNPTEDILIAARYYAYQLTKNLVPKKYSEIFQQQFKPKEEFLPIKANNQIQQENKDTNYLLTPSRMHVSQQLDDLLALREYRETATNEIQKYGGLGGVILEGEPGIGKSELVMTTLLQHGYQEIHFSNTLDKTCNSTTTKKIFYRMPVSMQSSDKTELLLKAFNKGAVVVIDEINSAPMMERLLNDLLMGKDPTGKRPEKPGFMIIGTQNPISMAGRRAPSTALARRLITTILPVYNTEELQTILTQKGLEPQKAQMIIQAYEKNCLKAKQNNLKPAPTFRDLLKFVKQILKSQKKKSTVQAAIYKNNLIHNQMNQNQIKQGNSKTQNNPLEIEQISSSNNFLNIQRFFNTPTQTSHNNEILDKNNNFQNSNISK